MYHQLLSVHLQPTRVSYFPPGQRKEGLPQFQNFSLHLYTRSSLLPLQGSCAINCPPSLMIQVFPSLLTLLPQKPCTLLVAPCG